MIGFTAVLFTFYLIFKLGGLCLFYIPKELYILSTIVILFFRIASFIIPPWIYMRLKGENLIEKKDFSILPFDAVRAALLGISLQITGGCIGIISEKIMLHFNIEPQSNVAPIPDNPVAIITAVIECCFIAGFFEEVFFRKFLYGCLKKESGLFAIILSSAAFSLIHRNLMIAVTTFFIGVVLCISQKKGYPLIFAMITHFFINFTAIGMEKGLYINPVINIFCLFAGVFYTAYFLIFQKPKKSYFAKEDQKISDILL